MQRIGDLLRSFLAGRLSGEDERLVALVSSCREILGEAGEHVRVRDLRGQTLVLEADHPGWAQLVLLRKSEILRRLGESGGGLRVGELRVVLGSGGASPRPSRKVPAARRAAPAELEEALRSVGDEGLRRSLRALYEQARRTEAEEAEERRIDTGSDAGV